MHKLDGNRVGIGSPFLFVTTVILDFFGATYVKLTNLLSKIG